MASVPQDQAQTAHWRPLEAILTAFAAVLYGMGWVVGVVWFVLTWMGAAFRVGFNEGGRR